MKKGWVILERLKQPSVLISIASQIAALLLLFNVQVDMNLVTGVITALCSIFVLLGILSDPTTETRGYGDDWQYCANCHKESRHITVNGQKICRDCGWDNTKTKKIK
ncbi:MAG: phage holin [Oscillospiraceae bacterium]